MNQYSFNYALKYLQNARLYTQRCEVARVNFYVSTGILNILGITSIHTSIFKGLVNNKYKLNKLIKADMEQRQTTAMICGNGERTKQMMQERVKCQRQHARLSCR